MLIYQRSAGYHLRDGTSDRHVVATGWLPLLLHCTTAYRSKKDGALSRRLLKFPLLGKGHSANASLLTSPEAAMGK